MTFELIDPPALLTSPTFAQGAIVTSGRTLYIGGQNGVDASGAMAEDLAGQVTRAAQNLVAVIEHAGGTLSDLVKLGVYLVDGQDLRAAYGSAAQVFGQHRATITVLKVAGLARLDALVELDGIAILD